MSSQDHEKLGNATKALQSALQQYRMVLSSSEASSVNSTVAVLDLSDKSAQLIKSHTTKLSLLLLNKPFTPSAIIREINSLIACVSALVATFQQCDPQKWSVALKNSLKSEISNLIKGLEQLALEVPVASATAQSSSDTLSLSYLSLEQGSRDTLSSTGVIWGSCDKFGSLKKTGLAGVLLEKALQQRALVKDAVDELDEWLHEPEPIDDEGFVEEDDDDPLADLMPRLPRTNIELRNQLEHSIKRLSLVAILFQALDKRRLRVPLPHANDGYKEEDVQLCDRVMAKMKGISAEADAMAGAFYELDGTLAKARLKSCLKKANQIAVDLEKTWTGESDQCTEWLQKWREQIKDDI